MEKDLFSCSFRPVALIWFHMWSSIRSPPRTVITRLNLPGYNPVLMAYNSYLAHTRALMYEPTIYAYVHICLPNIYLCLHVCVDPLKLIRLAVSIDVQRQTELSSDWWWEYDSKSLGAAVTHEANNFNVSVPTTVVDTEDWFGSLWMQPSWKKELCSYGLLKIIQANLHTFLHADEKTKW